MRRLLYNSSLGRVTLPQRLKPILTSSLEHHLNEGSESFSGILHCIAVDRGHAPRLEGIERLEVQDPRFVQTISVINLFEKQQERLPPLCSWIPDCRTTKYLGRHRLAYRLQLKRLADLLVAAALFATNGPFCWVGGAVDLA